MKRGDRREEAPLIGEDVYIGVGARVLGEVEIADGIVIGANAVVTTSFREPSITIAGIPARKISDKGTESFWKSDEEREKLAKFIARRRPWFFDEHV
jgi:serine O-acetyltransferase